MDTNKYIIYFDGPPIPLDRPVHLGANETGIRGTRYSTLDDLLSATNIGML